MKRAFIYKDEKSHKFWWIDYSGINDNFLYSNNIRFSLFRQRIA
jgi:predicted DNA-binding WGR domain protein